MQESWRLPVYRPSKRSGRSSLGCLVVIISLSCLLILFFYHNHKENKAWNEQQARAAAQISAYFESVVAEDPKVSLDQKEEGAIDKALEPYGVSAPHHPRRLTKLPTVGDLKQALGPPCHEEEAPEDGQLVLEPLSQFSGELVWSSSRCNSTDTTTVSLTAKLAAGQVTTITREYRKRPMWTVLQQTDICGSGLEVVSENDELEGGASHYAADSV